VRFLLRVRLLLRMRFSAQGHEWRPFGCETAAFVALCGETL
jgi:hypothetical protein